MKTRPSNVIIWVILGIVFLIGAYVTGSFLLQRQDSSPLVPKQNLDDRQLP